MRQINNPRRFTPLGIFMHEYCDPSETGLLIMNVDYLIHNYKTRQIMILEEKVGNEQVSYAQNAQLTQMDEVYRCGASPARVNYWGIFILRLPQSCTHVGPGIRLNGVPITVEQLVRHINFIEPAAPPINAIIFGQQTLDEAERRGYNGHS